MKSGLACHVLNREKGCKHLLLHLALHLAFHAVSCGLAWTVKPEGINSSLFSPGVYNLIRGDQVAAGSCLGRGGVHRAASPDKGVGKAEDGEDGQELQEVWVQGAGMQALKPRAKLPNERGPPDSVPAEPALGPWPLWASVLSSSE